VFPCFLFRLCVAMPKDGGTEGGGGAATARAAAVQPSEDIIKLDFSTGPFKVADGDVPVDWSRPKGGKKGDGKGKGRGKGKGKDSGPPQEPELKKDKNLAASMRKYSRGADLERKPRAGDDSKLGGKLRQQRNQDKEAAFRLAKGEVLQTEETGFIETEGREQTQKYSQAQIVEASTIGIAKKRFSFDLPYGPFDCGFTKNGQHLLAGGRKGQVAMMHCDTMQISCELQLKETIRAVQPLHNANMFAVAQKKYVYMYDGAGVEIHCIKDHKYPTHLDFLPYHYLLVVAGELASLHYRDISTGQEIAEHKTRLGPTRSMAQNPRNAVMHLGHSNGVVTMWTPTVKTPVVKVSCHGGHVTSLGVHGDYMVTAGAEGYWKIWDMRKYEPVHSFKSYGHAVSSLDVSMTGLLAVGFGSHVQVWKDAFDRERPSRPYLTEEYPGKAVSSVCFRPYEDVCAIGHSGGFAGILAPGAGMANFDTFEANPFETKKQRQEREVHSLLEKLQPDSIMLDPSRIGSIDKKVVKEYIAEQEKKAAEEKAANKKEKKKMRGKNKVGKRMKRASRKGAMDQRKKTRDRLAGEDGSDSEGGSEEESEDDGGDDDAPEGEASTGGAGPKPKGVGSALGRFYGKRRRKT